MLKCEACKKRIKSKDDLIIAPDPINFMTVSPYHLACFSRLLKKHFPVITGVPYNGRHIDIALIYFTTVVAVIALIFCILYNRTGHLFLLAIALGLVFMIIFKIYFRLKARRLESKI